MTTSRHCSQAKTPSSPGKTLKFAPQQRQLRGLGPAALLADRLKNSAPSAPSSSEYPSQKDSQPAHLSARNPPRVPLAKAMASIEPVCPQWGHRSMEDKISLRSG
jgi:hypothetical protein